MTITVTHRIHYGQLLLLTTAPAITRHSTIAAAAWNYTKNLTPPTYTRYPTSREIPVESPGNWCLPAYSGRWTQVSSDLKPDGCIRKTFTSWPVPA